MTKTKTQPHGVNTTEMAAFLDRVEALEEEKAALQEDIEAVFAEAKAAGFSLKHLRKVHALRKLPREDRILITHYANALQLFED